MSPTVAPFRSGPPEVTLVQAFARPLDNAVATARTCYSAKGIVTQEEVGGDTLSEEKRAIRHERRDALAKDLYAAGHHTTFQHAHFQFALDKISRQFVWTFLHSHPFYNSEQVSQRYVEVKAGTTIIPELENPEAQRVYEEAVERLHRDYHELRTLLTPVAESEFYKRFPARAHQPERWASEIQKRSQEVARYVLPIGTYCYLYHTVSALTLMRYHRLADQLDAPVEQRRVVQAMVDAVLELDPQFSVLLEEPIALEETLEYQFFQQNPGLRGAVLADEARREFDASLGGLVSRLVSHKPENETILAASVREVLGLPASALSDDDAITLVMDPASNTALSGSLNLTTLSKLSRTMVHPSYTFRKKLSHTADSQDQRHRATPGSRPCLNAYLSTEPDYVTPALVPLDEKVERRYQESMNRAWEAIGRLRALGVSEEYAAYLLPNAVSLRFTESADLLGLRHKCAMRLCLNAQEEIWRAARDESEQVREVNPRIGAFFLPPCGPRLRAGVKPYCPEGKRYCGVPAWKIPMREIVRTL
ncbi:MAG TPA: FAD-dependent thymidylate synthase [Candidatus Eisenbacteria bacterium]|nr:FAD-dependent thymidylate synthase [Candidatus Eisenbacteria bacterium]